MNTLRLGENCTKIGSGATPRGGSSAYHKSGIALIRSQNVYNAGFSISGLAFIDDDQATALANVEVQQDDVLLNITGDSVARVCQVRNDILPARVNQHVAIIRPNPDLLDPKFLRYYLTSPRFQDYMLSLAHGGATRKALTKGMIEEFDVAAPSIEEQRDIAHILGTLDDRIKLNREMNETLEAMARALFKCWFVDFEPVRMKAEGKDPSAPINEGGLGLDPAIAALFPESFQDSELGEIPKGWEVDTVGAILELLKKTVNPQKFPNTSFWHYSIPAFDKEKFPVQEDGDVIKSNKFVISKNSVLISKLNPRIPRVWFPSVDDSLKHVCSTEFLVCNPRDASAREYLYSLFTSRDFQLRFETLVTGTSGSHQRVLPNSLLNMDIVSPTSELMSAFSSLVRASLAQANSLILENQTLSSIRDAVLPKLISGELEVQGKGNSHD